MKRFLASLILLMSAAPLLAQNGGIDKDSLRVSGKAVVFFGPSQTEYLSLNGPEKNAIDEVLYDFYHYRGKVLNYLKENNIQEFSTAKLNIHVQLNDARRNIYNRRAFDQVVGLIMTDGQQAPKIFLGPATDAELISMFEEYFGLY